VGQGSLFPAKFGGADVIHAGNADVSGFLDERLDYERVCERFIRPNDLSDAKSYADIALSTFD
jgi:hypothetical protein